jgi:hypothetical protein
MARNSDWTACTAVEGWNKERQAGTCSSAHWMRYWKKQHVLDKGRDVISVYFHKRIVAYMEDIRRFVIEGMGDVRPGKFLDPTSGSLKGDKLLYDEIPTLVCTSSKQHIVVLDHKMTPHSI